MVFRSVASTYRPAVRAQTSPRTDGEPDAGRRCAVLGLVAVDQPEAWLAFVAIEVEADSTAVRQLWVATRTHELPRVRVSLALQEQLGDSTLQGLSVFSPLQVGVGGQRRQLGDIPLDSVGKLDLDLGSSIAAHGSANVDTEVSQRLGTVFGALGGAASDALGGKSLDLVVCLAVLEVGDLAFHLPHLRFEVTQFLVELPGFGPGKERHQNPRIVVQSAVTASLRDLGRLCAC